MVTAVTPQAGLVGVVSPGGTAVVVANPPINGIYITNPANATEPLFVNPVGVATLVASGATIALAAGQSWTGIPGSTLPVTVNAATNNHAFSVVRW